MRLWNRAKLLAAYLRRRTRVAALPVEYIVETTAKCNLYCPMCPRETHKQPKEDMADSTFASLVEAAGDSAEHMMLIGLGEPLLDPKIYERIAFCDRHRVFSLLSTNGTLLDATATERLLDTNLEHITLSFDGSTKESFEFYRKGARFEKVRDNFVHFARRKHERGSKMQVVVQMVRMERNWDEVAEFTKFWQAVPGGSALRPSMSHALTLAPRSTSSSTTVVMAAAAAISNGVLPASSTASSRSGFHSSSRSASARSVQQCSDVRPPG